MNTHMPQLPFPFDEQDEWPQTFALISLMPQYAHALVSGGKKYEYRRGKFIDRPVTAFVYATRPKSKADNGLPSAQILAVAKFGIPLTGLEETIRAKEEEQTGSEEMMREWLRGFTTASAHPIDRFEVLKEPISLEEMTKHFPSFRPPQRYLMLNRNQPLLDFLKKRSGIDL